MAFAKIYINCTLSLLNRLVLDSFQPHSRVFMSSPFLAASAICCLILSDQQLIAIIAKMADTIEQSKALLGNKGSVTQEPRPKSGLFQSYSSKPWAIMALRVAFLFSLLLAFIARNWLSLGHSSQLPPTPSPRLNVSPWHLYSSPFRLSRSSWSRNRGTCSRFGKGGVDKCFPDKSSSCDSHKNSKLINVGLHSEDWRSQFSSSRSHWNKPRCPLNCSRAWCGAR